MKTLKKTIFCILLACTFFVPAFAVKAQRTAVAATTPTGYTDAGDVDYVRNGKYVANWGAREEDCVFLSTYAQGFYTGSYVYETMSQQKGGTGKSNAPSSALYKSLQTLMSSKQTYQTSYNATRDLFCYTDCLQGNYSKISSFYSGKMISGTWDGGKTWNREHTWPDSKGDESGNGENDIMMLRPTSVSENSSRGNKAYGESGGYYNPNELGQDLHGDCARIVLYVYVRWGSTSMMWGSSGVIESLTTLLKWMEEDPVDTWEMGRNDAVQSITGTRNVFVDYPEYAWLLFGQSVPNNIVTPSGMAKGGSTTPPVDSSIDSSTDSSKDSSSVVTPPSGEISAYDYAFTSNPFSGNGTKALNGVSWTLAGDGGYWGFDGQNGKGAQFGSKNKPYKSMTFTSASFEGVTQIKLNTCGAAQIDGKCEVYVGGVLVETITLTSTDTDYTIDVNSLSGEIQLKYTQTSSKAFYIKSISITCVENEETPPVDSSVEESSSMEDSSEEISSSVEESSELIESSSEEESSVEFSSAEVESSEETSETESSEVIDSTVESSKEEENPALSESSKEEENSTLTESSTALESSNVAENSSEANSSAAQGDLSGMIGCSSSVGASMGGVLLLLTACSFVYKRKKKE